MNTAVATPVATPNIPAIKQRQQATWASGDYAVIGTTLQIVGEDLAEALDIRAGERVLDVAAGNGNATLAAARRFARVTSTDYVPALLDKGRERARAEGLSLRFVRFQAADAEALPFADGSFDVVMSTYGCMFTPDHARTAGEMLRVTRAGGRIGMANWTPQGFIGRLFTALKPFAAPPPPGAQPPPLWGDEDHVRSLLGAGVSSLHLERRQVVVEGFTSGAQWRDLFKAAYGPTVAAYAALADRPDDVAALDAALAALGDDALADGVMEWEYLLVVAERGR